MAAANWGGVKGMTRTHKTWMLLGAAYLVLLSDESNFTSWLLLL
jgi:hypothetical protein